MRLILLYAAQVAFIVAGFAAVSSVFVSINSDAMSSTVTQLLSSTATLATAQALAPLEKFSVQVLAYADMFLANPALQCSDPTSMEWTPEDISQSANPSYVTKPDFRATPGKMIKMAFLRNNLLAEYVYETMQMPRNASQLTDCGVGRQGGFGYAYEFFSPSFHHSGVTKSNDLVNCYVNTSETDGRLNSQFVLPGYYCSQDPDFNEVPHDFEIAARALTRNDSATGKWTIFTTFLDQQGITTTQLMTFGVPLSFSTPDPVTGAYHCTNAATMDLNAQYLTDALHGEVIAGVELAMFWDLKESLVSWTLTTPSSDPTTGALLSAGATGTLFDDAVTAFHDAGWCSGSAQLSGCVSPSDGSSVSSSRYVFALRRVVHINARFTIVISGDRDTFFGPGERARAVGIGVSVAVCVVCLATSVMLWLTTVRPLRRLISNMELASTFSSDVDAEGDSCITEVNEANVAFLSMHEQLQMAKPFMPQHLLEQFEDARRDPVNHFDSSDQNTTVTTNDDDARTVASNTRRSRAATHRSSGDSRGIATVVLESRLVAVLVINITAFDKLIRGSSAADIQVNYAKFIDVVLQVAKAHRGVLDSAQGDHIIVSFNTTLKCAAPASKAVNAAFLIRDALKAFPAAWQRITCGVSVGRAHCGTLGSHEFKSHATLGTVVRQAVGLQRVARALDDQRREGATSGCNDVSVAPGWCVGTARVVQDCATFAHFRYEAVASLPPSGRTTVIASIFPASISDQSLSRHPAGGNLIDNAAEWLYEVGVASTTNPHVEHNMQVQSRFANQNLSNLGHQEATGALTRSSAIVALAHTVHTLTLPLLYDA